MLVGLLVGMVALNVSLNLARVVRILKTELPRSLKSDLAGWQVLEAVVAVGMVVLFVSGRLNAALIYMAASFYLTFSVPRRTQELLATHEESTPDSTDEDSSSKS